MIGFEPTKFHSQNGYDEPSYATSRENQNLILKNFIY